MFDGASDGIPAVSEGSSPASAESRPATAVQAPQSPRRGDFKRAVYKRHSISANSVELLNVPPSKISVGPFNRVRSADRASSASAVDSVRSLTRSSFISCVVPGTPGTASTVSQESVTYVGRGSPLVPT